MTILEILTHLDAIFNPQPCPHHQHWAYIPQDHLYACTMKET